jgi:hypothetical protein
MASLKRTVYTSRQVPSVVPRHNFQDRSSTKTLQRLGRRISLAGLRGE